MRWCCNSTNKPLFIAHYILLLYSTYEVCIWETCALKSLSSRFGSLDNNRCTLHDLLWYSATRTLWLLSYNITTSSILAAAATFPYENRVALFDFRLGLLIIQPFDVPSILTFFFEDTFLYFIFSFINNVWRCERKIHHLLVPANKNNYCCLNDIYTRKRPI